jgi:hypothetical protein
MVHIGYQPAHAACPVCSKRRALIWCPRYGQASTTNLTNLIINRATGGASTGVCLPCPTKNTIQFDSSVPRCVFVLGMFVWYGQVWLCVVVRDITLASLVRLRPPTSSGGRCSCYHQSL